MVSIRQIGTRLCGGSLALVLALSGLMLSILVPVDAAAQVTTATLSGTVVDPTGAVVPKAKIVLTSQSTGATRTVVSNGEGVFSFSAVASGDFSLTIAAKGFESYTQTGIHLDPQDNRVLRALQLTLGSENTSVTVAATDAGINVDSGEISSLISAEDIKHLAIEGRDVTELLKILPGFTPVTTGVGNSVYDPSQVTVSGAVGNYSGNGSPLYAVALLSDGTDLTDPGNFGATIQTVNYDQVAEVKVETSSMTADTAHGPIIVNAVGASGGNKFHGSLYTYARTNQLDSQDWYSKHTSQPKPPDRQVYPGFTFGGPVLIPHTHFNDARKLNFWVGAEQYAQRDVYAYGSAAVATVAALVPTAGMRNGDYSQTQLQQYFGTLYSGATPAASNYDICPGTNYYVNSNYNQICAVPVTGQLGEGAPQAVSNGDISPYLDPGAKILLNLYPQPTPGLVPTANTPYNYIATNLVNNDLWQARGRLDYAPGEKTKVFAVYSAEKELTSNPQVPYYNPDAGVPLGGVDTPGGIGDVIHTQLAAINASTIVTPTLTNEFYLSGSLFQENWKVRTDAQTITATGYPYQGLYANGSNVLPQLGDYGYNGFPELFLQDYGSNGFDINKFIRTTGDNVTKQLGTHTIRIGAFAQWDINNQIGNYAGAPTNGAITNYYQGNNYRAPDGAEIYNTGPATGGNGNNWMADVAEGHISSFTQQNVGPGGNLYFWNIDGYAQDHWRALRHLSIDYGVRIEHITPWSDAHGVGIPTWVPAAYVTDQAGSPLPGLLWHSIDHSIPLSGYTTRWGYIEPRGGFSWDVYKEGKTILRGGFGIYRAHDSFNDAAKSQSEAAGVRTLIQSNTTLAIVNTSHAPVSLGLTPQQYAASNNGGGLAIFGVKGGDDEEPQVKTWDAAVVQKLPANMQLQIAYVGSYSNKMIDNGGQGSHAALDNVNALPVGALYSTGQYTTQDFNQIASLSGIAVDAFRQYPAYAGIYVASHRLYSNYNGLQTSLTKQSGHVLVSVNYTFSKALGVLGGDQNGTAVDPFNLRNNYGPETFDRTHVFNAAYTYQEGSPFHVPVAKHFLNEWELSGITNLLSGPSEQSVNPNFNLTGTIMGAPDPIQGNANNTYTLPLSSTVFLGTPDVLLQPKLLCNPTTGTGNHVYFNNACFGLPTQIGTNGTYRFPYLKGPGYVDSDLTLTKNIGLREGQSLHLRFAAFNFINRANTSFNSNLQGEYTLSYNYSNPAATNLGSSALLGSIPNTNASIFGHADLKQGRRIIELSLKYNF